MPSEQQSNTPRPEPLPGFRGEIVYLYAFDVANEIRLNRAAELLSGQ
jgi:hypothetical protein